MAPQAVNAEILYLTAVNSDGVAVGEAKPGDQVSFRLVASFWGDPISVAGQITAESLFNGGMTGTCTVEENRLGEQLIVCNFPTYQLTEADLTNSPVIFDATLYVDGTAYETPALELHVVTERTTPVATMMSMGGLYTGEEVGGLPSVERITQAAVGDVVLFAAQVINTGSSPLTVTTMSTTVADSESLTCINVNQELDAGLVDEGSAAICYFFHTVTADDLAAGEIVVPWVATTLDGQSLQSSFSIPVVAERTDIEVEVVFKDQFGNVLSGLQVERFFRVEVTLTNLSNNEVFNLRTATTGMNAGGFVCDRGWTWIQPGESVTCVKRGQLASWGQQGPVNTTEEGYPITIYARYSDRDWNPLETEPKTYLLPWYIPVVELQPQAPQTSPIYADTVISVTEGNFVQNVPVWEACVPNNNGGTYSGILGEPDYVADGPQTGNYSYADPRSPSLGYGGSITVGFTDNVLVGNGDESADLLIYEEGPDSEPADVFVSGYKADGTPTGQLYVGTTTGVDTQNGLQYFDVDFLALNDPSLANAYYDQVTITENGPVRTNPKCPLGAYNTTGPDIDAVAALSSAVSPTTPVVVQEVCTDGVTREASVSVPANTTVFTYTLVGTPAGGNTVVVEARLNGTFYWRTGPGWESGEDGVMRYVIHLEEGACEPATLPTVTISPAICTNTSKTSGSVEVETASMRGLELVGMNPAAPYAVDQVHDVTVTVRLMEGFSWPQSMSGWRVSDIDSSLASIEVQVAACNLMGSTQTPTAVPTSTPVVASPTAATSPTATTIALATPTNVPGTPTQDVVPSATSTATQIVVTGLANTGSGSGGLATAGILVTASVLVLAIALQPIGTQRRSNHR